MIEVIANDRLGRKGTFSLSSTFPSRRARVADHIPALFALMFVQSESSALLRTPSEISRSSSLLKRERTRRRSS